VLVDFLHANAETFAWSPSDMPGVPRDVAEHSLDIRAGARPVKQHLRRLDEEKRRAIGEEVHKLMAAGFIKEVFHPEWLANPVLVKKKGGKWRMCVDYTGLSKACSKVPYPLPRIDQIVDSTAGCETLSFLDAYSGYHRIKMKESDQLATSFITPFGIYCYTTMPFGLRNAGATYQRCMNHVFGEHIGRTVEAYVDDIVVKTKKASDLLSDLETTFKCLRAKGVKLNPEKCVFGVPPRHAPGVHRLRVGHRGQPGENRGHHQHGTYQRFERSTKGHGMPCGSEPLVGAKAKTPPFALGLRHSRWSNRDKAGRDTLRSIQHFDEGLRQRLPATRLHSVPRPTCDLAHCNGPCVAAFVLRA
jgi:hypothetical protein